MILAWFSRFKHQYLQMFYLKLIKKIWVVLTHLKLWVTVARHNLQWVKIRTI